MNLSAAEPPRVVLDTNVVFDWLLFRNPAGVALGAAITAGRAIWVANAAMRDEVAHVLARGSLDAWAPDLPMLWAAWDRHCVELPAPVVPRAMPSPATTTRLRRPVRCTDPDDQKFIDLAVACGARWLLSRDRAVLELAPSLRELGVEAVAPGAWALAHEKGATGVAPSGT